MEWVMVVTNEDLDILYNSDVEFYLDEKHEISFDSIEEYEKAKEILNKAKED